MKIKGKYTTYGILYLILSIISMSFIDNIFNIFATEPDIYSLCILVLVSFVWWKSLCGMCKYIVYIRFIKLAEEAKMNAGKRED